MASPVDAGRVATPFAAVDPWPVGLPAGIVAGDLLLLFIRTGGVGQPQNHPSPNGFSLLLADSADATDDLTCVYYKRADGTEGTSLSLDMNVALKGAAIVWRITGAANPATQVPQVSTAQVFTTTANTGNPPAISPTGGSKDYLFITCLGCGGTSGAGGVPAGYTAAVGTNSTGGSAATNCSIGGGSKQATTATEDAGVWTHAAASVGGCTFTIAIHPAGPQTLFGAVAGAFTFGQTTSGTRKTFSSLTRPFTFTAATAGIIKPPAVTYYGATSANFSFGSTIAGRRKTFSSIALPFSFSRTISGQRRTFATLSLALSFSRAVSARRTTFSSVSSPYVFIASVSGTATSGAVTHYAAVSAAFNFGRTTSGQRKTFGQVTAPWIFSRSTQASRRTFGVISTPFVVTITTKGVIAGITPPQVPLGDADTLYLGTTPVDSVYVGGTKVWPV